MTEIKAVQGKKVVVVKAKVPRKKDGWLMGKSEAGLVKLAKKVESLDSEQRKVLLTALQAET